MKIFFGGIPVFFDFCFRPKTLAKKPWFFCKCFDLGNRTVGVGLRVFCESVNRIFFNNQYNEKPLDFCGFYFSQFCCISFSAYAARHPGAGRDPVGTPCQPVSFSIITQVLRNAKLDTARPRYDDSAGPIGIAT
jgi:hypothetical protein